MYKCKVNMRNAISDPTALQVGVGWQLTLGVSKLTQRFLPKVEPVKEFARKKIMSPRYQRLALARLSIIGSGMATEVI